MFNMPFNIQYFSIKGNNSDQWDIPKLYFFISMKHPFFIQKINSKLKMYNIKLGIGSIPKHLSMQDMSFSSRLDMLGLWKKMSLKFNYQGA